MKKTIINDIVCCGARDAARYLGTNARGLQKLVDAKEVNFETNGRLNSTRIYIHVNDLVKVKYGENK